MPVTPDLHGEALTVRDEVGAVTFEFRFRDLSGDWGDATFSPDGHYLILGLPYDLYIFRRVADTGQGA